METGMKAVHVAQLKAGADDGLVDAAIPPILSVATSAMELSDCRIRRARMVVVGSMVSSLSFLSTLAASPDAALHQPSCPILSGNLRR